jgi:hypothetical protein
MMKRDNAFVDSIIELADQHFARNEEISNLHTAVIERFEGAERVFAATGLPLRSLEGRWAIRRVLFQPNAQRGLEQRQHLMRRAALEKLLSLCKEPGGARDGNVPPPRR